jgi:diguanylate cyclase (GGDEF)-like protein
VVRDSTERKRIEAELAHRAAHDPLTGLPNRARFAEHLDQALTAGAAPNDGVAVLFLDLDGFKTVNDALGHAAGDALLVAVAERLRRCVRPGDAIARLGGDEFTVLLAGVTGLEEAARVADRMRQALAEPFAIGGREVVVTTSVGIAVGAVGDGVERDLVREADAAMYRAKRGGDDRGAALDPPVKVAS